MIRRDVYVAPTIGCSSLIPLQSRISISAWRGKVQETRTYTMYPKNTAGQIPVLKGGASGKPHCRFARVDSACNDVIFRRVWRSDPASGILL
jgi:hypothetical protein